MFDEASLRAFGALIVRMQLHQNLTREETHLAYRAILRNEQPDLHQGAFIAALRTKGETMDELLGIVDGQDEEWNRHLSGHVTSPEPHLSIVGVGMDTLKTVNVSSGATIIAAACGLYIHKIGGPGMTGVSGSGDAFTIMGCDPDADHEAVLRAVSEAHLGFSSIMGAPMLKMGYLRVLGQLRCGTPMHFAGPIAHQSGEKHKICGVPALPMTTVQCTAMKHLGYERALVPCGASDEHPGRFMDEISNLGTTHIAELTASGDVIEYDVRPEDAGLKRASYDDVAPAKTAVENVRIVARVIAGKVEGPVLDLLALNAASALKLMGKVPDLGTGVERAKEAVKSGAALEQIRNTIRAQNRDPAAGLAKLEALIEGR
ncbi:MAG: hypothetical protein U0441_19300 [Polyangiaceae bacterium]